MKLIKILVFTLISYLLSGCGNYDELKVDLQTEYDRMNESGNRASCYFVGNVKFPYTEESVTEADHRYDALNKNRLAIRLPLFADLGLLKREEVSNSPLLYRYDLTEEGKQYQFKHVQYNSDWVKNEHYFCFGRLVIQEITDVEDSTHQLYSWGGKYTRTTVNYTYILENLPEWAKSEELYRTYKQLPGLYNSKDIYSGATYLKKENGAYYNDGGISWETSGYY